MRFAVLLGCLYVLLLAVKPCCTDDACIPLLPAKSGQLSKATKGPEPCSDCSPFFSCGQCVGFVVAKHVTYSLATVTERLVTSRPRYLAPHVYEVSQRIWQPPQLG